MSAFDVDEKLVKKLAKLLEETGLNEIEYEADDRRIRVSAKTYPSIPQPSVLLQPPLMQASANPPASVPSSGQINSPMVGTVYLASEPGGTPFVKIGDNVAKGQTLLIVEAMKVMNPIAAPTSGIVKSIFVTDGQPVEFGEALIVVE